MIDGPDGAGPAEDVTLLNAAEPWAERRADGLDLSPGLDLDLSLDLGAEVRRNQVHGAPERARHGRNQVRVVMDKTTIPVEAENGVIMAWPTRADHGRVHDRGGLGRCGHGQDDVAPSRATRRIPVWHGRDGWVRVCIRRRFAGGTRT
jgi:hypothetical protein